MTKDVPTLTILMATYNGSEFIAEQLASLDNQDLKKIILVVSDDGSSDDTLEIIKKHCEQNATYELKFLTGPKKGFSANFRHLILETEPDDGYFAFCDQDDIWVEEKSKWSFDWLNSVDAKTPALYCGRTRIMNQDGGLTNVQSPLFTKAPSFQNALVQSIAGANTMTMNGPAFAKIRASLTKGTPVSHDWWSYMVITGVGGKVHYETRPIVNYRQHAANLIGSNSSLKSRIKRIVMALNGRFRIWNAKNLTLLNACETLFTHSNRAHLNDLNAIHNGNILMRIKQLHASHLHRQTLFGQLSLWLAAVLGKF